MFWFIFYLLVPVVSLVRLRFPPAELPHHPPVPAEHLTWRDVLAGISFVAPVFAVVAAGMLILVHNAATSPSPFGLSAPACVGIALLLLATLRPEVVFLEHEQLRRERVTPRSPRSVRGGSQTRAWRRS